MHAYLYFVEYPNLAIYFQAAGRYFSVINETRPAVHLTRTCPQKAWEIIGIIIS